MPISTSARFLPPNLSKKPFSFASEALLERFPGEFRLGVIAAPRLEISTAEYRMLLRRFTRCRYQRIALRDDAVAARMGGAGVEGDISAIIAARFA